jgi:hypothetical protein
MIRDIGRSIKQGVAGNYPFVSITPLTPGPVGKTVNFNGPNDSVVHTINDKLGPPFFGFGGDHVMERWTVVDFQAGFGQSIYTLVWDIDMRELAPILSLELSTLGRSSRRELSVTTHRFEWNYPPLFRAVS